MMVLGLMSHARMREGFREQERIAELVTDAVFERIHLEGEPTTAMRFFQGAAVSSPPSATGRFGKRPSLTLALPLLKDCDRRNQVEGSLEHRVAHRCFFRATAPPLRRFRGFEFRVLPGNKCGFI